MKVFHLFLIAISLVVSCGAMSQPGAPLKEVNNFVINNGVVTWSNVYNFSLEEMNSIHEWFYSNFNVSRENEKSIIAETYKNVLPINEVGLDRMSVVMILTHPCVVYFTTEFKEDRYRVTINRVIWYPQVAVTTYNVTQGVGAMDLNDLALKKGNTFRSSFCKSISEHLNRIFTYMFTYHKVHEEQNDDW